jgi:hypothetical protein
VLRAQQARFVGLGGDCEHVATGLAIHGRLWLALDSDVVEGQADYAHLLSELAEECSNGRLAPFAMAAQHGAHAGIVRRIGGTPAEPK